MSVNRLLLSRAFVACALLGLVGSTSACDESSRRRNDEQSGRETTECDSDQSGGVFEGPYHCAESDGTSEQSAVVAQLSAEDLPVPADVDSCAEWTDTVRQHVAEALNASIRGRVTRPLLAIGARVRCDHAATLEVYVLPLGGPWKSFTVTEFATSPVVVGPDDGELPDGVAVEVLDQTEEPPSSGI